MLERRDKVGRVLGSRRREIDRVDGEGIRNSIVWCCCVDKLRGPR